MSGTHRSKVCRRPSLPVGEIVLSSPPVPRTCQVTRGGCVPDDVAASNPDDHDASLAGGAWSDGPMADASRLGRHLSDLASSGRNMPRPYARRRAASITSFVTDHDGDFARAGVSADRRASLLVRAARLENVVAWEEWDEVRAIVAGMTFDLAPFLCPAPAVPEPPRTTMRPSRTVRPVWRRGRRRTADENGQRQYAEPIGQG